MTVFYRNILRKFYYKELSLTMKKLASNAFSHGR